MYYTFINTKEAIFWVHVCWKHLFSSVFLKKETANWFKGIPIILYSNTYKYYCLYQQKYIESSRKDGINRLQFLASVEEKMWNLWTITKKAFGYVAGRRVVYFDVLEIQSSHMWMNIVFLQMLSLRENILFEKLCGNSDGWIFFAAQTCIQWWENNIG